jgi:hypothetical protein
VSHSFSEVQILVFRDAQLAQDLQSFEWVGHSSRTDPAVPNKD